jgi:hypothetical protein
MYIQKIKQVFSRMQTGELSQPKPIGKCITQRLIFAADNACHAIEFFKKPLHSAIVSLRSKLKSPLLDRVPVDPASEFGAVVSVAVVVVDGMRRRWGFGGRFDGGSELTKSGLLRKSSRRYNSFFFLI